MRLLLMHVIIFLPVWLTFTLLRFRLTSRLFMLWSLLMVVFFFFQAEDGIRDVAVTGVQTCALPISNCHRWRRWWPRRRQRCAWTGCRCPSTRRWLHQHRCERLRHRERAKRRLAGDRKSVV